MRKFKEKDRAPIVACSTVKLSVETYNTVYPKCRIRKDLPRENDYVYVLIPYERIAADAILDVWGVKKDGSTKYKSSYIKVVNETLRYPTAGMLEKLEGANVPEKKKEDIKKIVAIVNAYQTKLKEKGLDFPEPINPASAQSQEQVSNTPPKKDASAKVSQTKKKFDELLSEQPAALEKPVVKVPTVEDISKEKSPDVKPETVATNDNIAEPITDKTEDSVPAPDIKDAEVEVPIFETAPVAVSEKDDNKNGDTEIVNNDSTEKDDLEEICSILDTVDIPAFRTQPEASDKKDEYPEDAPKEVEIDFGFDTEVSPEDTAEPIDKKAPDKKSETTIAVKPSNEGSTPVKNNESVDSPTKGAFNEIDFSLNLTVDDIIAMEEEKKPKVKVIEPNPNDEVFPDDYFDDYFDDEETAVEASEKTDSVPETTDNSVLPETPVETPTDINVVETPSDSSSDDDDDDIYKEFFDNY